MNLRRVHLAISTVKNNTRSLAVLVRLGLLVPALILSLYLGAPAASADPKAASKSPAAILIGVINRAEWCSVCKANGPRVARTIAAANGDAAISIVVNDLTDAETTKRSLGALQAAGVEAAMEPYSATGVFYLFDARSKRPLRQVTVANSDDEIRTVIAMARKQVAP